MPKTGRSYVELYTLALEYQSSIAPLAPTVRGFGRAWGIKSTSQVYLRLNEMARMGLVRAVTNDCQMTKYFAIEKK